MASLVCFFLVLVVFGKPLRKNLKDGETKTFSGKLQRVHRHISSSLVDSFPLLVSLKFFLVASDEEGSRQDDTFQ